jgi:hypothetical protein
MDEAVGHHRRFTAALADLLTGCGFALVASSR